MGRKGKGGGEVMEEQGKAGEAKRTSEHYHSSKFTTKPLVNWNVKVY